jgi:hypothetical protein
VSLRKAILFRDGKATMILRAQCSQQGALQPIMAGARLLEADRSASRYMRSWWRVAFPEREHLPFGPVATEDGLGTDVFWDLMR